MLETTLNNLGLDPTETKIFGCLLSSGPMTGGRLAKRSGINRSTTYSALERLESRGLIKKLQDNSVTGFCLVDREQITSSFEKELKRKVREEHEAIKDLGQQLTKYPEQRGFQQSDFGVRTYDSIKGVEMVLEAALLSGQYVGIFDPQSAFSGQLKKTAEEFLRQSRQSQPQVRELAVDGPLARWWVSSIKNPNHQVKLLKSSTRLTTDILITKNKVYLNSYSSGQEMAIEIRHPGYHEMMMFTFQSLWDRTK